MAANLNTPGNLNSPRFPNLETVIARQVIPTQATQPTPAMLPTPTTRDWKDGSQYSCQNTPSNALLGLEIHQATNSPLTGDPLYLNPYFVTEMMGFPLEWLG
jgi:hypothetical protein